MMQALAEIVYNATPLYVTTSLYEFSTVCILGEGDIVFVIGTENGFYLCLSSGGIGWLDMHCNILKIP